MKPPGAHQYGIRTGPFYQDVVAPLTGEAAPSGAVVAGLARTESGEVLAAAGEELVRHDAAQGWTRVPGPPEPVQRLWPAASGAICAASSGLLICRPDGPAAPLPWPGKSVASSGRELPAELIMAVAGSAPDALYILTSRRLLTPSGASAPLPTGATATALARLKGGDILVGADIGLYHLEGAELAPIQPMPGGPQPPEPGEIYDILCLAADGAGGCWIGAEDGLRYYAADAAIALTGSISPPIRWVEQVLVGGQGEVWIGGPEGAARLLGGGWSYFAGKRWLPDNRVTALASDGAGGAWVGTAEGLRHIERRKMTLPEKAAYYQRVTRVRHVRSGYVAGCRLEAPGDTSRFTIMADDNDGLWTSLYVAAECFRYAVTGAPDARSNALESLHALMDLVAVTGIPGFPARALVREGETVLLSDPGPNWYASPVEPGTMYKDDTSSDEVDGHFLAWYLAHELVAGPEDRERIVTTCRDVTEHILDNGYRLVGPTGRQTRWGVWAPDALNEDPNWGAERGLNSLEILSHLRVAEHIAPCERFRSAYRELVTRHRYALNTVLQKVTPPEGSWNHSDDELAWCAYYPLLMLENDPALRSLYLLSLQRTHAFLAPQRSPLHNVLYTACTGRPDGSGEALRWLQEAPLDLLDWGVSNSRRPDVALSKARGRFQEAQLTRALSPRETRVNRWNANPYRADEEGEGRWELDGAHWLLPYWLGRYHGLYLDRELG